MSAFIRYVPSILGGGSSGGGSGTVNSVTLNTGNGFAGIVTNPTSTPAITLSTTITGLLKGNGTAISAQTVGDLTEVTSSVLTLSGNAGSILGSGTTIAVKQSSALQSGYLSSTDWSTFNSKQGAGNYITALTGDGSASGPNSAALTLATVNSNVGSFTYGSFTVNAKGLITAASSGTAPLTSLTGDVTTATSGAAAATLATVNANVGAFTYGSFTVNAKGLITAASSGTAPLTSLTGDVTTSTSGAAAATLATVNANVGAFTLSNVTVNEKGLVTAASSATTTGSGSVVVLQNSPTLINPEIGGATGVTLDLARSVNGVALNVVSLGAQSSTGGSGISIGADPSAAISSGSKLGFLAFAGAIDTFGDLANSSLIQSFATENWSGSAHGSKLTIYVTPNTTTATAVAATFDQDKSFTTVGNVIAPQIQSTISTGSAPFIVASSTVVNNLNAATAVSPTTGTSHGAVTLDSSGHFQSVAPGAAGNALVSSGSDWASSSVFPPGMVTMYGGAAAPTGWLLCDGSAVSRTTYAALFAVLGTTYGVGDGSSTFNVPNAGGVFVRGSGSQNISGLSYTGTQGTTQFDQTQGHRHAPLIGTAFWMAQNGTILAGGSTAGKNDAVTTGDPVNDGTNGTPRVGTETRPANIVLTYIIKI